MKVYVISNYDYDEIAIAESYKAAAQFVIKHIDDDYALGRYQYESIKNVFGENWRYIMTNVWDMKQFNEVFYPYISIDAADLYKEDAE